METGFVAALCAIVHVLIQIGLCVRVLLRPHREPASRIAWIVVIAWQFFGIGPGAVIGNTIFGAPGAGRDAWTFGIPSIWAWQILFWVLGVAMMWFLAYKLEMSTVPDREITALVEDIGDVAVTPPAQAGSGGAA